MDIHEYIGRYTVLKKLKKNLLEGERRGGGGGNIKLQRAFEIWRRSD